MAEITANQVMEAVNALREEVKKYGSDAHQVKEMEEKTEKLLADYDAQNQKNVLAIEDARKSADEVNERVKALELSIAKSESGKKENYREKPEYKALKHYMQKGHRGLDVEEVKTLRTDDSSAGGYLVMPEIDNVIMKKVTEISPMENVARVRTVNVKTFDMPVRTGLLTASYEGEAQAGDESESTYGSESISTYRLTVTVPVTQDMLMDAAFDVENEISQDVAEAFAYTRGNKFVLGTGVKQPEGFVVNATVLANKQTSAASATVDLDDAITLSGTLKKGYNPAYYFNRTLLASFRKEQSSAGGYLWVPGGAAGEPATLNGYPYVIMPDMANVSASSYSLAFADMMKAYTIINRTGIMVIRDELTGKKSAIVEITFHQWNNGMVVLPEAISLMQTHA